MHCRAQAYAHVQVRQRSRAKYNTSKKYCFVSAQLTDLEITSRRALPEGWVTWALRHGLTACFFLIFLIYPSVSSAILSTFQVGKVAANEVTAK